MKTILKIFLTLSFLLDLLVSFGQETNDKYYGKHVIIAIDQTGDVYRHQNMNMVYNWLERLLKNEELSLVDMDPSSVLCSDFMFNENTDCISLYAFGLEGKSANYPYDKDRNVYMRIKNKQQTKVVDTMEIARAIIDGRIGFNGEKGSVSDYLKNIIHPLMFGEDKKAKTISEIGGVTFSFYVYPTILAMLDVEIPAEEYYFVFITNFKSGSMGGVNSQDDVLLTQWLTDDICRNKFKSMLSLLNEQYAKTEIMSMIPKKTGIKKDDEESPIIQLFKLNPKKTVIESSEKADIESNINIRQEEYGSPVFKVDKVDVRLPNSSINNVLVVMKNGEKEDLLREYIGIEKIDERNRSQLPEMEFECENLKENEILDFKYVFYPKRNVNDLLPLVYTAEKSVKLNASNFTSEPVPNDSEDSEHYWKYALSVLLGLIGVGIILYYIWVRRGKNAKPEIMIDVDPISNTHYMDVTDGKAEDFDCWYQENESDRLRKIIFHINVSKPKTHFAKKMHYVLHYQIEKIDRNHQFSFRPSELDGRGLPRELGKPQLLTSFNFNKKPCFEAAVPVDAFVDSNEPVDFSLNNVLEVKIKVWVCLDESNKNKRITPITEEPYSFIVRPKLTNPNVWVAFDAGTTGATVAYGITGSMYDNDDMHLVQYEEQETGSDTRMSAIYPSVVAIPDSSRVFHRNISVEEFVEETDFLFGSAARKEPWNKFQSIKKFLGYKSPQRIFDGKNEATISGQDLAHLLVKGMYKALENNISALKVEDTVRRHFYDHNDFSPKRAIVAVPNNYTLNKVQDMVDSVKRLKKFTEVHYIYESEGVMMTFLRRNISKINDLQNRVFIVFDMGGATINATAFRLSVKTDENKNIRRIRLKTESKIGYYVGGDDIDYALIQFVYGIPSVKRVLAEKIHKDDKNPVTEQDLREQQKQHKNNLIDLARKIKLDWIDVQNGMAKHDNNMTSVEVFWSFLDSQLQDVFGISSIGEIGEDDEIFIKDESRKHNIMTEYVYHYVSDALEELLNVESLKNDQNIELVLSGRSILYPGIKDSLMKVFDSKRKEVEIWNGFMKEGSSAFDDQKVKTAVAEGACWYAMYSNVIRLEHNTLTSSYGFIDQYEAKNFFHEMIAKGTKFKDNGWCEAEVKSNELKNRMLSDVKFIQMLGTNHDEILKSGIRQKMNKLDEVKPDQLITNIDRILFRIDNKGNYEYEIFLKGFENHPITEDYPITKKSTRALVLAKDIQLEIKDENSPAYEFATLNVSTNRPPSNSEKNTVDKSSSNNTTNKGTNRV